MNTATSADMEIVGLLIAPREFSYLKTFVAPGFSSDSQQFVPFQKGLNVVFGRNGSGKSSLLKMIESAVMGSGSPFEGVLVQLTEGFAEEQIASYRKTAELFGGRLQREAPGALLNDAWELDSSQDVLQEWLKHRYALISKALNTSEFLGTPTPEVIGRQKGNHQMSFESRPFSVDLDVTPVIRVTPDDTPSTLNSIHAIKRVFKAATSRNAIDADSIADSDRQLATFSPLANPRNFLGDGYADRDYREAGMYFLESFPRRIKTYPKSDSLAREGFEAPAPFFSTISDGFEAAHESSTVPDSSSTLRAMKLRELRTISQLPDVSITQAFSVRDSIRHVADLFDYAFPVFRNSTLIDGSPRGMLLGYEPFVSFRDTGSTNLTLSSAQARWFQIGLASLLDEPDLLLIDEPETGLDRNALRAISKTLVSDWLNGSVKIVVSHSPSLLNNRNSNLMLIDDQQVRPFTTSEIESLERYGLNATDLIELKRAFLIVEGEHDKDVLNHFFRKDFEDLGISIIPAGGIKNASRVPDWSWLLSVTDCPIYVLTDNMNMDLLKNVYSYAWQEFQKHGDWGKVNDWVQSQLDPDGEGSEGAAMKTFIMEAVKVKDSNRFLPIGLSKPDVLDYLAPEVFELEGTWSGLREEFAKQRSEILDTGKRKYANFKDWVKKTKQINLPDANVVRTHLNANGQDAICDPELVGLVDFIRSQLR